MYCPCQEWLSEGSIMGVCGRQKKKEWQAGPTADEGMDSIATQEGTRMLSRSMAKGGVRIGAAPSKDRNAIDDEIAGPNEPTAQSGQDCQNEEGLWKRRFGLMSTLALLRR
jgi:hypothetical protein